MADLYKKDDLHYLKHLAPMPTLPFMDIRDYDLPYGGRSLLHDSFAKSHTATSPFQFKAGNVKKEGAELLSSLTGVKSDVSPHKHWVPGCGRVRCKYDREFTVETVAQLDELYEEKKRRLPKPPSQRSRRSCICYMVDESVDTGDLEGLVFNIDTESESAIQEQSSSSSSDEDESDRSKANVLERTPEEYFALVKESMSRIGLRTQMLHDLSLGECPPPKEVPPPAPARPGAPAQPPAPAVEESPYMSHTSLTVKQARKLAGLMHVDEQAVDLRDLLSWIEKMAGMSEVKSKEFEQRRSLRPESTEQMKKRLQNVGGSDWRLPASPPIALQLANDDLRNRLANLFQEKNFLNNKLKSLRLEELDEDMENKPEEFISALRALEEDYELLGASVSQNLETAERLEERYLLLEQQLNATGNSAGKHLHDVEKVKSLLGLEATEALKKLPPKPEVDPAQAAAELAETKEETKEGTKEEKKKKKKSKSPDVVGDAEEVSQPPIRIQSKVYPRKSPSPKPSKAEEERRSPSPLSDTQTPDSKSTTRSAAGSEGEVPGKTIIQILQDERSASSTDTRGLAAAESRSRTDDSSGTPEKRVRRPGKKDKAVQTDAISILSLMEENGEMDVEKILAKADTKATALPAPSATTKQAVALQTAKDVCAAPPETKVEYQAPSPTLEEDAHKVKVLHKELEKSKKQLNFYRARNWAEKHDAHAVPTPVTPQPQEEPLPAEGDVGLIFVYNPTSGFHTMLTSGEVGHKNKGSLIRGSTVYHDKPMSAPAGVSRSQMPVSTNNKVISAQQVMKLIAKRREQQQAGKK